MKINFKKIIHSRVEGISNPLLEEQIQSLASTEKPENDPHFKYQKLASLAGVSAQSSLFLAGYFSEPLLKVAGLLGLSLYIQNSLIPQKTIEEAH
jgi:hypothetical protein